MPTLVATADPVHGNVLIVIDQTIIFDTYTRVVAPGWGNATPTGQAWSASGGAAADFSVNGATGLVSQSTVNVSRFTFINSSSVDHEVTGQVTIPVVPTGAPVTETIIIRSPGGVDGIYINISIATTNVVTLTMTYLFGGSTGTLATTTLVETHAAAATWFIKASACGNLIRAKAWRSTVAEPDWLISSTPPLPNTGTIVGTRSRLDAGNTNVLPVVVAWDNFRVNVGSPVRLWRVIDGVSTEVRGSPFYTDNDADAVFWDNESPFDVDMTYTLTSNCSDTVQGTSNAVNLDSVDGGWLRDPVNPSLNVRIELDGFFDECEAIDRVVFSGLGSPTYANASGIFDLINSPRPSTISQVRKNYASSLALTSFSLDDILNLEDILAFGRVLTLSLPVGSTYGWAQRSYGTDYITVGDVQQAYIGIDQRVVTRNWALPFRLALAPRDVDELNTGGNGIGGGGATYDDLAASVLGTTYNSLTASGSSYNLIAQGGGY